MKKLKFILESQDCYNNVDSNEETEEGQMNNTSVTKAEVVDKTVTKDDIIKNNEVSNVGQKNADEIY